MDAFPYEKLFTPAWHWKFSRLLGDIKDEIGYIDDNGLVQLLGEKDPDLTKYDLESKTNGPVTSITAKKGMGAL